MTGPIQKSSPSILPPLAEEPVLSTLNKDGTRRWLRPRPSPGRFQNRRAIVGWALIALFWIAPWISVDGRPLVLLDLPRREFTFFGVTFLSNDTPLLMLLLLGIFVSIFLLTAVLGRAWCGWGCPQTVYMEFVYRPIERLFEGSLSDQRRLDQKNGPSPRRVLKHLTFALISFLVANVFLSYFVGAHTLVGWMQRSPFEHPAPFVVVAAVSGLMYFDFAWFREQMCTVACPYARLQSVLLDRSSLVVGYDALRGEPRGKLQKSPLAVLQNTPAQGDCIDCRACVQTCPTGIDIRQGLQLECIACAQCIDACDSIMDRIQKPRGLIRYATQDQLERAPARGHRWRLAIYPLVLVIVGGLFAMFLSAREVARVTVLRPGGAPFTVSAEGLVTNQVRLKVQSLERESRRFFISLEDGPGITMIAPENPLALDAGERAETSIFLNAPESSFEHGQRPVTIVLRAEGTDYVKEIQHRMVGPDRKGDR